MLFLSREDFLNEVFSSTEPKETLSFALALCSGEPRSARCIVCEEQVWVCRTIARAFPRRGDRREPGESDAWIDCRARRTNGSGTPGGPHSMHDDDHRARLREIVA